VHLIWIPFPPYAPSTALTQLSRTLTVESRAIEERVWRNYAKFDLPPACFDSVSLVNRNVASWANTTWLPYLHLINMKPRAA